MTAFQQFVVKLHGSCDLACDYCYMYQHVDQTWRQRKGRMSDNVLVALAARIGDHVRRNQLTRIRVILHGGEPLLAGKAVIAQTVETIRAALPSASMAEFGIQTNGVRLDTEFLSLFRRLGIRVGVSLDGGSDDHNRHRRFAHGATSFGQVAAALRMLGSPAYRQIYGGILCVIDLANDPIEVYRSLLAFAPPVIGLTLPHGNWVHPPPGRNIGDSATPYGDWLVRVFDEWYSAPERTTSIRSFDAIITMLLGGTSDVDGFGTTPTGAVIIDIDGSIQRSDSLKTTAPGAAETGLNVVNDSFEVALSLPEIQAEQRSQQSFPAACRECPFAKVCGGGLYAHRFHPVDGFDHQSVYCADLMLLIGHIQHRVSADLAERVTRLGPLTPSVT